MHSTPDMDSLLPSVKRGSPNFGDYNAIQPIVDIVTIAIKDYCAILTHLRFVVQNSYCQSYFLDDVMALKVNEPGSHPHQRLQKIEYLREMLVELKATASRENEHLLAYFLEMAYFEACDSITKLEKSMVKIRNGNHSSGMSM